MFCDEVLESVEPLAAGDLAPDDRLTAHLRSCGHCATALEEARQLERLLKARTVEKPPPQFTVRTVGRLRRDRWRREQFIDAGFNIAIGLAAISVVVMILMLVWRSGVAAVSREAVNLVNQQVVGLARRIAPSVPLYAGAAALLGTALGLWWWAERDAV